MLLFIYKLCVCAQSCWLFATSWDCSPPGSSVHGIIPARILKQVDIFSSRSEVKWFSPVQLFVTPWTIAYQDPLSMGFSRQEYWSGLPFPSPRKLCPFKQDTKSWFGTRISGHDLWLRLYPLFLFHTSMLRSSTEKCPTEALTVRCGT